MLETTPSPDETVYSPGEREKILGKVDPKAELPALPMGVEPNCDVLFTEGREVVCFGEKGRISLKDLGSICISSGMIGASDFQDIGFGDFVPLSRSVSPGDYRVELAVVGSSVVAGRLLINEKAKVHCWRPACDAGTTDHTMTGDAASIFDAVAAMELTEVDHERRYDEVVRPIFGTKGVAKQLLTLGKGPNARPDCAVFQGGHGNARALRYWGLDQEGKHVSLVIDFLVLARDRREKVSVPWTSAQLGEFIQHPTLEKWGVLMMVVCMDSADGESDTKEQPILGYHARGLRVVRVVGQRRVFMSACLTDANGRVLIDTTTGGSGCGDTEEKGVYLDLYDTEEDLRGIENATLEVTLDTGYRN